MNTGRAGEVLRPAQVRWDADQCLSAEHGDRYFSPDGVREVERVFVAPVRLAERLAAETAAHPDLTFTVGELGFGTGLNAAVLAEIFLTQAAPSSRLHLISAERAPLAASDMRRMASRFSSRLPVYRELCASYPPLLSGWHRIHLAAGRVVMSVYFGAASDALADLQGRQQRPVDHWLLDGFAPRKNPSLWQPALFQQMAALSRIGTTVATYSAVGAVRRNLQNAGFKMRKVDQMPIKLHSLAGEFAAEGMPNFIPPPRVRIVGAGIAGASCARGLAERGVEVEVLAPPSGVARHASRIPAAVMHGRLRDDGSAAAAWQALSSHYSHQRLKSLPGFAPTGAQQISGANSSPERLAAILARYQDSGDWLEQHQEPASRFRTATAALRFNIGGVVNGPTLCRALLDHPLIKVQAEPENPPSPTIDSQAAKTNPIPTVLANAIASQSHPAARYLEIAALAGQAELCSHPSPPGEAIVGAGYLAPCRGGFVIGSTYEYRRWTYADAVAANLAPWQNRGRHRASFRGFRTITSDRVCIVGDLYDRELAPIPHLKVITGFGSTGMTSAPLAGECVAAELAGEFSPVTPDLIQATTSARFRHRQSRRGPRMNADPS